MNGDPYNHNPFAGPEDRARDTRSEFEANRQLRQGVSGEQAARGLRAAREAVWPVPHRERSW